MTKPLSLSQARLAVENALESAENARADALEEVREVVENARHRRDVLGFDVTLDEVFDQLLDLEVER